MKQYKKVLLAYSGGLDTSIIIPWLKENYGCEVIAVAADVGQESELEGLEEKAIKTGASKLYIEDLTKELSYRYKDMEFKITGKSTIDKADNLFEKIELVLFVFSILIMLSSFLLIGEVTFLNVLSKKKDFAIMKCFGASTLI